MALRIEKTSILRHAEPIHLDETNEATQDPRPSVREIFELYRDGMQLDKNRFIWQGIEYEYDADSDQLTTVAHYASGKRYSSAEFWQETYDTKTRKQVAELQEDKYIDFLSESGFIRMLDPSGDYYDLVRQDGKFLTMIGGDRSYFKVSDFVREHIQRSGNAEARKMLVRKNGIMFSEPVIKQLPYLSEQLLTDDDKTCYIPYRNGLLSITADKIELIPYVRATGLIWKDRQIDRDWKPLGPDDIESGQFYRLLQFNAAGKQARDLADLPKADNSFRMDDGDIRSTAIASRFASFITAYGYSCYRYKDPRVNKAILCVDQSPQTSGLQANGGTGKKLAGESIGRIRNQFFAEGRIIDIKSASAFARLNRRHEHVWIPDLDRNFPIELFLNKLTEGWTTRELYKNETVMNYADSPKVWLDTNYTLRGSGNTFDRRLHVLEFSNYFNKNHTPFDEFKNLLFDQWDESEWLRFDNFCAWAVQRYMRWGLVESDTSDYKSRKLKGDIPASAIDYFDDLKLGERYPVKTYTDATKTVRGLLDDYIQFNPEVRTYKGGVSLNKFREWLNQWADNKMYLINAHVTAADGRERIYCGDDNKRIDHLTITNPAKPETPSY